ncbi:MAG: homocysteine S-methyltransferase family protein [Clostridia bacterium]|nr:homocysteine S-methyltransferase family protein [Clostridia bacterium]
MTFSEFSKQNIVILDGGMGTLLEKRGIKPGEKSEEWNISHPDVIYEIQKSYFDAGSNVVNTNTFGANLFKFEKAELEKIILSAVSLAKRAREDSQSKKEKFIALDIGPTGKLIKPFGDMDFEKAYEIFSETVRIGVKYGVDLITVETMNDSMETRAALLAVKDNSDLPVIVTNAYGTDSKLLSGASPETMAAMLEGMGADFIGANCSLGPKALFPVIESLLENSSVPTVFKPNAGLPEIKSGETVYNVSPEEFARDVVDMVRLGVRVVGGCCGTTPEYIKALSDKLEGLNPKPVSKKNKTVVTSFCKALKLGGKMTLIGESINPTGKKRMRRAVEEGDVDFIVSTAISEEELGADALDINVGVPGIDETAFIEKVVSSVQYSSSLPLCIDTSSAEAMEAALRIYNGKAIINSVNGKPSSMEKIFPLMKKYGGVAIALTLDENGIPETADGRMEIAKKILAEAERYGIDKKDIIFDPLAMTVSADKNSALVTLECIKRIKTELGCHTSLGVSNISFGLPKRDIVNSVFFAMAYQNGLSAAIMNPASAEMMKSYYAASLLLGLDDNSKNYVAAAENMEIGGMSLSVKKEESLSSLTLSESIIKGLSERATEITRELLKTVSAMDIVNSEIIPALDKVGRGFEEGSVYLPGLLLSAETAKSAFSEIKSSVSGSTSKNGVEIVIATVKGDIHDIGKNIVKLLLENYGFEVIDLGKDVAPETIVSEAEKHSADIVGLSALMTTTVPAMEETVKLLKERHPTVKVMVGGAVLNEEYARKIGADAYAKDAMSAVRYAEAFIK